MQTYLEIFLIGLLGSVHCIGMCGGFVAMYTLKKSPSTPSLSYHLLYNFGRITTYSFLGGLMGIIGSYGAYIGNLRGLPGAALLLAGAIMVLMGLNIAGVLGKKGMFEDTGITQAPIFRKPFRRILEMETVWSTFLLGLLLGFLPCGLLYPIFISAAATGNFFSGTITMAVFGLGTVPVMLSFGFLIAKMRPHLKTLLYRIASILIVFLGLRTFLRGMAFNGWIPMGKFW